MSTITFDSTAHVQQVRGKAESCHCQLFLSQQPGMFIRALCCLLLPAPVSPPTPQPFVEFLFLNPVVVVGGRE